MSFIYLFTISLLVFSRPKKTNVELKSSQNPRENPNLGLKSRKIQMRTEEDVAGRNCACGFVLFTYMTPSWLDFQSFLPN